MLLFLSPIEDTRLSPKEVSHNSSSPSPLFLSPQNDATYKNKALQPYVGPFMANFSASIFIS
jgi:hypothetical protein